MGVELLMQQRAWCGPHQHTASHATQTNRIPPTAQRDWPPAVIEPPRTYSQHNHFQTPRLAARPPDVFDLGSRLRSPLIAPSNRQLGHTQSREATPVATLLAVPHRSRETAFLVRRQPNHSVTGNHPSQPSIPRIKIRAACATLVVDPLTAPPSTRI